MKLRNKNTGEIIDLDIANIKAQFGGISVIPEPAKLGGDEYVYHSLAELNEDWEDYAPKEPLIKDEKIRKAVRAWVDLYGYKFVTHRFYSTTTGYRWSLLARETQEICLPELDGLDESKDYTIDELCGEEEE